MAHSYGQSDGVVQTVKTENGIAIVKVVGAVDMHSSPGLRSELLKVLNGKLSAVVVNLEEVPFMDSSGLATLVEALQVTRQKNVKLKLVNLSPRVWSVFKIARLDTIFEIFDNEAEALA